MANGYPSAHCRVRGGHDKRQALNVFQSHNFTQRVDVLLPLDLYHYLSSSHLLPSYKIYRIKCKLDLVLNTELIRVIRNGYVVKLMTETRENVPGIFVSIIKNNLCLTLDRDNCLKTGLNMKKSQFGVDRYNLVLDLTKKDLASDPVFLKVLRFLQSNPDNSPNLFILSVEPPKELSAEILSRLRAEVDVEEIFIKEILTETMKLSSVDLSIQKNDVDWCLQTLEYLAYLSIGGQQLTSKVDPYISRYCETTDLPLKLDVVKISYEAEMLPSAAISQFYMDNVKEDRWVAILVKGVPNTNYSFGLSEHIFHESGENDTCFLQSDGEYVLWEFVGGRDNH